MNQKRTIHSSFPDDQPVNKKQKKVDGDDESDQTQNLFKEIPAEIIGYIFTFVGLTIRERLTLSSFSHEFYEIMMMKGGEFQLWLRRRSIEHVVKGGELEHFHLWFKGHLENERKIIEHVVKLSLESDSLPDNLSDNFLGLFKNLKEIELHYANSESNKLDFLMILSSNLEAISLKGDNNQTPIELTQFPNLKKLTMTGAWPFDTLNIIKKLTNLETLNISTVDFLEESVVKYDFDLRDFDLRGLKLKHLDVGGTKFPDQELYEMLQDMKLERIGIGRMDISLESFNVIESITTLKELDISNNMLNTDSQKRIIFEKIMQMTNLTSLDLSFSSLKDHHLAMFSGLTNLETLKLRDNEITKITLLPALQSLKYLDISSNLISFFNLSHLTKLETLVCNFNLCSFQYDKKERQDFSSMDSLTHIHLCGSKVRNSLARTIFNLKNIKFINLEGNYIDENFFLEDGEETLEEVFYEKQFDYINIKNMFNKNRKLPDEVIELLESIEEEYQPYLIYK